MQLLVVAVVGAAAVLGFNGWPAVQLPHVRVSMCFCGQLLYGCCHWLANGCSLAAVDGQPRNWSDDHPCVVWLLLLGVMQCANASGADRPMLAEACGRGLAEVQPYAYRLRVAWLAMLGSEHVFGTAWLATL